MLEQKPARYWGVIGRQHLLRIFEQEQTEITEIFFSRSLFSLCAPVQNCFVMRRCRLANTPPEKRKYLRKSQLWSEDFTAKLFCNVEFWLERLPRLIAPEPGFSTSA